VIVTTSDVRQAEEKISLSQHTLRWHELIGLVCRVARAV
jgi:hypothetical protein